MDTMYLNRAAQLLGHDPPDKWEEPLPSDVLAGAMLLAAMSGGSKLTQIAETMKLPASRIKPTFRRFRKGGVFDNEGRVVVDWMDSDDEGMAVGFTCDVMVGTGMLEREG